MACQQGSIRVTLRRSGAETVIHVLAWPDKTRPYVTSSACLDRRTLRESWGIGDRGAISQRLGDRDGDRKGRVLYFLEPALGVSQTAYAAALLHVPDHGEIGVRRICYRLEIPDRYATLARYTLLSAAYDAATRAQRPGIIWRTPMNSVGEMLRERSEFTRIGNERDHALLRWR
jgi:hypothetical protein